MNIGTFELFMVVLIPTATFLLNAWRKRINSSNKSAQFAYIFISVVLATAPFAYVRSIEPNQSGVGVLLAGIAFFWFAIVGARRASK